MGEIYKMHEPSIDELVNLGFSRKLAEGALKVVEQYGTVDLPKYQAILGNVLNELIMRVESPSSEITGQSVPDKVDPELPMPTERSIDDTVSNPASTPDKTSQEISNGEEDLEDKLMGLIKELYNETSNGTLYQDLWEKASSIGFDRNQVEECITALEDKGLIYEPSIGVLKLVNP
jgi:hypothetical protein